ncbi:MAG: CPBP family intramembrane metalloprotease [Saprospiraceae bacterium]|nr:CPBP family intramembrane metalloprotease [Saprospiraceae bacterium]
MEEASALEMNTRRPDGPRVRQVLMAQLAFCVLGSLLAAMLFQLVAIAAGWDTEVLRSGFSADAPPEKVWQMRLLLGLSHLFTFVVAGAATVRVFYPVTDFTQSWNLDWPGYLGARRWPSPAVLGTAILLLLTSLPLVLFSFNLNKLIPLPETLRMLENDSTEALKALLRMETPLELLANLTLLAVLPALGEELVFRGILQRQLMRRIANPWVVILLSGAIFSFIHFQFEGFLPRWLLGVLLGWLYWRTGNFWVPVLAHFANNALQVVGQYLYGQKLTTVDLEQDVQIPWLAALMSAALVVVVARLLDRQLLAETVPSSSSNP